MTKTLDRWYAEGVICQQNAPANETTEMALLRRRDEYEITLKLWREKKSLKTYRAFLKGQVQALPESGQS